MKKELKITNDMSIIINNKNVKQLICTIYPKIQSFVLYIQTTTAAHALIESSDMVSLWEYFRLNPGEASNNLGTFAYTLSAVITESIRDDVLYTPLKKIDIKKTIADIVNSYLKEV